MNIAICEDTEKDLKLLLSYLNQYALAHSIAFQITSYKNAEELLKDDSILHNSCIFLDIYMKDITGMECAHRLRNAGYEGSFIFATSSRDHVFESFLVEVLDYLVKPFDYPRFCLTMDKFCKKYKTNLLFITLKCSDGLIDIPIHNILYIDSASHYTYIHTKEKTLRTLLPIAKLEELLKIYGIFLRCHRSYIVNMNYITSIEDTTLLISSGDKILLSIRNIPKTKQRIADFMWAKAQEAES